MQRNSIILLLLLSVTLLALSGVSSASEVVDNSTYDTSDVDITTHESTGNDFKIEKNLEEKTVNNKLSQPTEVLLEADDVECFIDDTVDIIATTEPFGIDDGILSYYVDNEYVTSRNLSVSSPTLEFDTTGYDAGVYDIHITYSGSLIYDSTECDATLTINKHLTEITNITSVFDESNNIRVTFNVECNDNPVNEGTVDVYYNDEVIESVDLSNDDAIITLESLYNGEILEFVYTGNYYYNNSARNVLVYVDKLKCDIYTAALRGYQSSVINSSVIFYTEKEVGDGNLDLYVNHQLVKEYDVNETPLLIEVDLAGYVEGVYDVRLEYVNSNVFTDAVYNTTLTVNKINTVTYTRNVTVHRNEMVNLTASVYNYVDDTDEGILEFFIDDESIETILLRNTTSYVLYQIPDNLEYGLHDIIIHYYGTQKYNDSVAHGVLNLTRYNANIFIRNTTLDDEASIVLNVRVSSYGRTVNDGVIRYYVDGEYVGEVNVTGNITQITLPDSYVADNEYEILLEYCDSEIFTNCTNTSTIHPERHTTTMYISKYLSNKDILNITTYVYSDDYSNINEGSVDFYLNDILIGTSGVENNSGRLEFNMSEYPAGNYTIHADYSGTKLYKEVSNNMDVEKTIQQKTIYIQCDSQIKVAPDDTIIINATLIDYEANRVNESIPATITINNETIDVEFVNGSLNYNLTMNQTGNYTITIKTENTTQYKTTTRNITLNVQRNYAYITSGNYYANKLESVLVNATLHTTNQEIITARTPAAIKINNKTVYQGFFTDGSLTYNLTLSDKITDDEYNLTIIAGQTTKYNKTTKVCKLTLNSRKTYITSKNIQSKNGDIIIFNATIMDSKTQKNIITNPTVCIKINNKTIDHIQSTNGHIVYRYYNELAAKDYNITIKMGNTSIYEESQWNGVLTNTRRPIKIEAQNIHAKSNTTITIKAKFIENDKIINTTLPVAIKINENTITRLNVRNGTLNYEYKLPDDFNNKIYNITIVNGATDEYENQTANIQLILNKNYQQIKTSNITAHANDTIHIHANISDEQGNPIASNSKVCIKIASRTIVDMNATDGIINYDYNIGDLKSGIYDLLIKTGENPCYYAASTHAILKVE